MDDLPFKTVAIPIFGRFTDTCKAPKKFLFMETYTKNNNSEDFNKEKTDSYNSIYQEIDISNFKH